VGQDEQAMLPLQLQGETVMTVIGKATERNYCSILNLFWKSELKLAHSQEWLNIADCIDWQQS